MANENSTASPAYRFKAMVTIKTKLHGMSPRAKYTDRVTAAC
jgi:hypothetical protein